MNKVILMGRLTKDAELRYSQSGTAVTKFTVAVDRKFSKEKEADFINCTAFNKTAEFISQYFTKGQMIALEGRLQTGSYEKDGEKRFTTDVMVDSVEFCGGKADKTAEHKDNTAEVAGEVVTFTDDELPF